MIKSIKFALWLCLLSLAAGAGTGLNAAEPTAPAPNTKGTTTALSAKIVVVNKADRTVTVEIKGKLYLFKVTPSMQITKKGKGVTLDELASGQEISLVARELPDGNLEVVSVSVETNQVASEAAGKALGKGRGSRSKDNPPFGNFPNPANVGGPIISPNN
jgi:hypothetical protein